MKAKDYALDLITKSQAAAVELANAPVSDFKVALVRLGANVCVDVLRETQEAVRKTKTVQATLGAFREGLTKWKAVVRLVQEQYPGHPVTVNYFGMSIAMDKPSAFEQLVANNVFLGYEFGPKEQEILDAMKEKKMEADVTARFNYLVSCFMLGR